MSLAVSRRRRRWAIWAALAVAGGYGAYKLYTSDSGRRKRQQLARLCSVLLVLGDAVHQSAESAALVSADLKRFLTSDEDELPRSLRQVLKIAHSPDFQHSCTLLSAALTRGFFRGLTSQAPKPPPRPTPPVDEPPCTEIKEICLISPADLPGIQRERKQCFEENDLHNSGAKVIGPNIYVDKSRQHIENKFSEEILERLFSKLFSDPGLNFASVVLGNVACNVVNAMFDGFASQKKSQAGAGKAQDASSHLVEILCTQQCKALINECIETFVNTAVAVYLDKTKDVNFYEDMVAGITNHKDPMKDLLTGVCNGAVETLVKSSHSVMFGNKGRLQSRVSNQALHRYAIDEISGGLEIQKGAELHTKIEHYQGQAMNSDGDFGPSCSRKDLRVPPSPITEEFMQRQDMQATASYGMLRKPWQEENRVHSFIDGISKSLAIPSNHRLVVDVAGTMTSEAVRSFLDVIVSNIRKNFHGKTLRGWGRVIGGTSLIESQAAFKDAARKAFLLASICLALCLHMLTCIRIEVV